MNEKEKKIIEQRTIEATRKGLMGISGKIGLIVQYLGQEIVVQNEGYMSEYIGITSTPAPLEPEEDLQEGEFQTAEVLDAFGYPIETPKGYGWEEKEIHRKQMSSYPIGWYFDGLNRGIHIDIKYIEEKSELTVNYEGNLVFKEIAGELLAYNPSGWEEKLDGFYKIANKMDNERRKKEKITRIEEAVNRKESWIQKMKKNWGL